MLPRWLSLAIVLIAAVTCNSARAQTATAAGPRVVHETWDFKDGAPQLTVGLAQTADGYLWLAATSGLYRFDGTRFELFRSPFGDRLLSTNVASLIASEGGLWVGYGYGGFSFVKNGRVRNYPETTGRVINFASDAQGVVWAAANKPGQSGLWRFDGSAWRMIGADWDMPQKPVAQVGFDREGILWVLVGPRGPEYPKELYYLMPGERRLRKAAEGVRSEMWAMDADKRVLTTREPGRAEGSFTVELAGPLPSYPVLTTLHAQFVDRANGVWTIIRTTGVMRFFAADPLGALVSPFPPPGSEKIDIAPTIPARLVDREGSVWIGSASVLHRFSYSPVVLWDRPSEPSPLYVVMPDEAPHVWITASDGQGHSTLSRVDKGTLTTRSLPAGVSMLGWRAPDRTFYLGGEGGLWHLVDGALANVELPPEVAKEGRRLQTMAQDAEGAIWGSFGPLGLYRLKEGEWTKYRSAGQAQSGCPQTATLSSFTDSLGRVLFGCTDSRVAVFDRDRERVFGPQDGIEVGNVTAIGGPGRAIWIGGEFGLQHFDGERFRTVRALDPEALRGISGIIERANGDLWLNGLGGIVHIARADIERALSESDYQVNTQRFDRRSGVPGIPSQQQQLPTAVEGTDGRLWFTVHNNVVWIDPDRASAVTTPPAVSIQSIVADDKAYELAAATTLPAGTTTLQIGYAALSLLHPDGIRFRYRLHGIGEAWHDAGRSTSVSYRSLAPGDYRFEVGATDVNGVWSNEVAHASITILPSFYQTGWFRIFCGLLLLFMGWTAYRLRIRQLRHQFERTLEARVAERTRIARDLHDTMLQKFHAVLMQFQIAFMQLPPDAAKSREALQTAIDQAADAITEGRDAVQGLRDSTTHTNDLSEGIRRVAAGLADGEAPEVRIDVEGTPRDLHPIVRGEVLRVAEEALRNAVRHSHASRVEVHIHYDARQLRLRVRDDGRGIDPAILEAGERAGHFGMPGMRERAQVIGGKLTLRSDATAGTEIELTVPGSRAYPAARGARAPFIDKLFNRSVRQDPDGSSPPM